MDVSAVPPTFVNLRMIQASPTFGNAESRRQMGALLLRIAGIGYSGLNEKVVYPDVYLCAASAL